MSRDDSMRGGDTDRGEGGGVRGRRSAAAGGGRRAAGGGRRAALESPSESAEWIALGERTSTAVLSGDSERAFPRQRVDAFCLFIYLMRNGHNKAIRFHW